MKIWIITSHEADEDHHGYDALYGVFDSEERADVHMNPTTWGRWETREKRESEMNKAEP